MPSGSAACHSVMDDQRIGPAGLRHSGVRRSRPAAGEGGVELLREVGELVERVGHPRPVVAIGGQQALPEQPGLALLSRCQLGVAALGEEGGVVQRAAGAQGEGEGGQEAALALGDPARPQVLGERADGRVARGQAAVGGAEELNGVVIQLLAGRPGDSAWA
jgi:hypothetical protein